MIPVLLGAILAAALIVAYAAGVVSGRRSERQQRDQRDWRLIATLNARVHADNH